MSRVRDRWPDGVGTKHVSMPVALLRHACALGLDDGDIRLLLALETFQWGNGRRVTPSQETLAELCGGCSVKKIQRRVNKLVGLGLIEVERTRGARSTWGSYSYTREGLGEALRRLESSVDRRTSVSGGEDADQRTSVSGGDGGDQRTPVSGDQRTSVSGDQWTPVSAETDSVEADAEKQTHTARAREVLAVFCEVTGGDFGAEQYVAVIADRIAEKPDLSVADHRAIITGLLDGSHWWGEGIPSPQVVYRDQAAFERTLNDARRPRRERPKPRQRRGNYNHLIEDGS